MEPAGDRRAKKRLRVAHGERRANSAAHLWFLIRTVAGLSDASRTSGSCSAAWRRRASRRRLATLSDNAWWRGEPTIATRARAHRYNKSRLILLSQRRSK